ncbi:protein NUCLEAR FUSION DEFECTIVE 6, mitochondrial isoform X2 [Vicia villosa]|uniref:protein NUCLEAR FUSION DEFECTIVE 6, mitochondrial isoform X1 n=1 Tax=Vicia villosa TaxID=3911 RepID=UPI00273B64CC|nr:protein NUCLEAR FUSION DEFECTIVE 6, mitochondrial isoform X1 [Vicia villosa]XP_058776469.1 protein NUCLEAR FUSION DEFECTIVE 6, mitochondrial isoform X2 [Vicia villosa]
MASNCCRKSLQIASSSAKTLISRRSPLPSSSASSSNPNKFNASASSFQASPHKRSFSNSWVPVQLAGAQVSLTPLHSATASALFTSLLSLHNNNWGCLSEGFATTL